MSRRTASLLACGCASEALPGPLPASGAGAAAPYHPHLFEAHGHSTCPRHLFKLRVEEQAQTIPVESHTVGEHDTRHDSF